MDSTYLSLKVLHVFGVVIFLGNIIVTGWWKVMADRTRSPKVIAFAQRQVTVTDFVFTAGGVVLILATGHANATGLYENYRDILWLGWGLWLFIASGIIWVAVLIPVQIKQARLARAFESTGVIPTEYWSLSRVWLVFGTAATVLPLVNIYWMVVKPI